MVAVMTTALPTMVLPPAAACAERVHLRSPIPTRPPGALWLGWCGSCDYRCGRGLVESVDLLGLRRREDFQPKVFQDLVAGCTGPQKHDLVGILLRVEREIPAGTK